MRLSNLALSTVKINISENYFGYFNIEDPTRQDFVFDPVSTILDLEFIKGKLDVLGFFPPM